MLRLLIPVLPLLLALPAGADELAERERLAATVQILFDREDFEELTRIAREYRASEARSPSGLWMLSHFYDGLDALGVGEKEAGYWDALDAKAARWAEQHPREPAAHITRALLRLGRAWARRGRGLAKDVPPEAWQPFERGVRKARAILLEQHEVASWDPHWYAALFHAALGQPWAERTLDALLEEALARFPAYHPIYFRVAQHRQPAWGGSAEAIEAFARDAVERTRDSEGTSLYARIYWSVSRGQYGDALFEDSQVDWEDMRRGFEDLLERHPDAWNLNHFARFACLAGDAATTGRLLRRMGGDAIPQVWDRGVGLARCRELVARAGHPPDRADASAAPALACPEGTIPRRRRGPALLGHGAMGQAPIYELRYCAMPAEGRPARVRLVGGDPGFTRRGPHQAFDSQGHWVELGEYGPAPHDPRQTRMVGAWRHRKRGSCGDWIEWTVYHRRGPDDDGWRHFARPPIHLFNPETTRCPAGLEAKGRNVSQRITKTCERDGVRDGPAWVWFEDGGLHMEQSWSDGMLDGPFRVHHSNGVPRWEGTFRRNREVGVWRQFDCFGEVLCEGRAENGAIVDGWRCRDGDTPPIRGWLQLDED